MRAEEEKEEVKMETEKKIDNCKVCLQQNRSEDFQEFQYSMNSNLSPYEETMIINLIPLSSNTFKDVFYTLKVSWETSQIKEVQQ